MASEQFLIKPSESRRGQIALLFPASSGVETVRVIGPDGNVIFASIGRSTGQNTAENPRRSEGLSNDDRPTFFLNQFPAGSRVVGLRNGQEVFSETAINPLGRQEGGELVSGGGGIPRPGFGQGFGQPILGEDGQPLGFVPNFADFSTLTPQFIESRDVGFEQITGTEPQDISGTVQNIAEQNRENILQSFSIARDISQGNFEAARQQITDINAFNRQIAQQRLGQQEREVLQTGLDTLQAFGEGRAPDPVVNEVMNAVTRAQQAEQANIVGGGATSSFGTRVGTQLNVAQRLGLQQSALQQAPSFIANALELRQGPTQFAQFNPAEVGQIARDISSATTLAPAAAVQGEFQNISNELATQRFNAEGAFQADKFSSAQDFAAQQYNSQLDFKTQMEQLYAEQYAANTTASIANSAINQQLELEQQQKALEEYAKGQKEAQKAQAIQAGVGLLTAGLGAAAKAGVFKGLFGGAAAAGAGTGTATAGAGTGTAAAGAGTGAAATGTGTGTGFSALGAAGVVAGAYTGYQQLKGIEGALEGKRMSAQQKASLALPTFGLSLVWDDLKSSLDGVWGSGKGEDQQERDGIRSALESAGQLVRANDVGDNANVVNESLAQSRGNNSHLIELADGSYFDIGNDGGDILANIGKNIDGKTERNYHMVDFSDDRSEQSVSWTNPLSYVLAGSGKFVGHLTNAAQSNNDNIYTTKLNTQHFAEQAGVSYNDGLERLGLLHSEGVLNNNDYTAFLMGWADLWDR